VIAKICNRGIDVTGCNLQSTTPLGLREKEREGVMGMDDRHFCPSFHPTRADFSRPFCEYVQEVCKNNPDIAMFKVVPPKGWAPRKGEFPNLQDLRIDTPIKQHVSAIWETNCQMLSQGRRLALMYTSIVIHY
jgi:hypothetical protein